MPDLKETVSVWETYLATVGDWQSLVEGIEPKSGGCGLVYEVQNPIERPSESFAIADMRDLEVSEPHMHINGEVEIYFVLQGVGKIAVGGDITQLSPGVSIITPPNTMHCTVPEKDLVLAVVNTPPFKAENYVVMLETDLIVAEALEKLST